MRIVEGHTNRIKLFPVHGWSAGILMKLIMQKVKPGTNVYTDGWRGYNDLKDYGLNHWTVEHKYALQAVCRDEISGQDGAVHTNCTEGA